jgi:hypothetical protein
MPEEKKEEKKVEQKQIKISDEIDGSSYANAVQIKQQGDEIHLVFMTMFGEGENKSGKVTSKVTMTRGTYKNLLEGMAKHQKAMEKKEAKPKK